MIIVEFPDVSIPKLEVGSERNSNMIKYERLIFLCPERMLCLHVPAVVHFDYLEPFY